MNVKIQNLGKGNKVGLRMWKKIIQSRFYTYLCLCQITQLIACGGAIEAPVSFKDQPENYHLILNEREIAVKSISGELSVEIWQDNKRVSRLIHLL